MSKDNINKLIRAHQETIASWDLTQLSTFLYKWHDRLNRQFFGGALSSPVIGLRITAAGVYGNYVMGCNAIGVRHNININGRYKDYPLWFLLTILVHQMVHQFQEECSEGQSSRKSYHNQEFRGKMASIGLLCDEHGILIAAPMDPFLFLLCEYGVEIGPETPVCNDKDKWWKVSQILGKSKLKKHTCGCPINVWAADSRFMAICSHCKRIFKVQEEEPLHGRK